MKLETIQDLIAANPTNTKFIEQERLIWGEFIMWNKVAHFYVLQKPKATWLVQGDRNTAYFHASLKHRYYRNNNYSISDGNGNILTDLNAVRQHLRDFYIRLLGEKGPTTIDIDAAVIQEGAKWSLLQPFSDSV